MNNTDLAVAFNTGFIMVGLMGIILAFVYLKSKKTYRKS